MPSISPRVFIIRHGATEWSINGRHTGSTELPLTESGEQRILATGKALVGKQRMIDPDSLLHIYVSPRKRAQRTLELLHLGCHERLPWAEQNADHPVHASCGEKIKVQVTEDIREWDYGEYEGLTSQTIREQREKNGQPAWNIWRDGCPGGESPTQVTERVDRLIADIRRRFHQPAMETNSQKSDVLVVAHGHILRAFATRWIGKNLTDGVSLLLEAGGVGMLSYEHHNIDEPAIMLGGAFMPYE